MQNFVLVTLTVAMATLKNLYFSVIFRPSGARFFNIHRSAMGVAPFEHSGHARSSGAIKFELALMVFEIFCSELGLSETPKFERHHYRHVTAAARIMKFGIVIELIEPNILCNHAEPRSRKPWVPGAKNCFWANFQ